MIEPAHFVFGHDRIDTGRPDVVLLLARYDETRFDGSLFNISGIPLPDSLATARDVRLCEFLAGRLLAASALSHLSLPPAPIGRAADRRPIWPYDLGGSISHARGFVACLVTRGGDPGVDVETTAEGQTLAALQRHAMTDEDRMVLAGSVPWMTTLVFSAKETLFKALYPRVGKSFGFDAAALAGLPGDQALTLRLTRDLAPDLRHNSRFTLGFRHRPDHVLTWLLPPVP